MIMETAHPTESELAILQILWEHGPSSVRFVHERLQSQREYTTTLKLMQLMAEKGLAARDTRRKVHIYRALVSESSVQGNLLHRFVQNTFRGSAAKLVLRALGQNPTSAEELEEIKRLIEAMEQKKNN